MSELLLVLAVSNALHACGALYYTAAPIEAWVIDADRGQPIADAIVTANWQLVAFGVDTGGRKLAQLKVMERRTDSSGRFRFPGFTQINAFGGELREEDPQILIFKPGYQYFRDAHTYPLGKEGSQGTYRQATVAGKRLPLTKAPEDARKYAQNLGGLGTHIANIVNAGNANSIPLTIHALVCEQRRLGAIDFRAMFDVPGATGGERCEAN